MNTLVLGGNGFIGSHVIDKLLIHGHSVHVLDRYEERFRKPNNDVEYIVAEMGNRGVIEQAVKGMDVVFHFVNTTLPANSNKDPAFDVKSNVIETIYLLEKCVESGVKKVVFLSSGGTVYGRPDVVPVGENSATNPECSYGITKLTIEKYLSLFKQLHGLDYTIIRPSNPFGERQNPNGIQGVIPVFLGQIAKGSPITIWGDGEVVRDYLYIKDLVDAIYCAATQNLGEKVYNIGSGVGHSLNDLLKIIHTVTGLDLNVKYDRGRSFDIPSIFLDISRAKHDMQWLPGVSLEDGIGETWEFVRTMFPKPKFSS